MHRNRLTLTLLVLLVGACAPAPLEARLSATPAVVTATREPATATPIVAATTRPPPTSTIAPVRPEDLVGTWQVPGIVVQYRDDGTYRLAMTVDTLESEPVVLGDYAFDGLTLTMIDSGGRLACKGEARWLMRIAPRERVTVVETDDPCGRRARNAMEGDWIWVGP